MSAEIHNWIESNHAVNLVLPDRPTPAPHAQFVAMRQVLQNRGRINLRGTILLGAASRELCATASPRPTASMPSTSP